MAVNQKIAEALKRISFEHREADYHHHTYDEDMFQYELIRNGDMKAAEIGKKMFEGPTTGHLSDDPVRNYQFLFVASITLASRFCIEGGMPTAIFPRYLSRKSAFRSPNTCAACASIRQKHFCNILTSPAWKLRNTFVFPLTVIFPRHSANIPEKRPGNTGS